MTRFLVTALSAGSTSRRRPVGVLTRLGELIPQCPGLTFDEEEIVRILSYDSKPNDPIRKFAFHHLLPRTGVSGEQGEERTESALERTRRVLEASEEDRDVVRFDSDRALFRDLGI